MSAEPLDEIQWKSPEWIQQFGLHTGNVLDYFSELPFYDRTSNNQVLRMQFQFQQIPPNVHPAKYLQTRLTEMVGTEFVVAFVREPDFWVVRKQRRLDPYNTVTEHDYYIIGANVYQSPMVYDVLSARLLSTVLSMKKSMSLLNKMASFSISEGGHTYASESAGNANLTKPGASAGALGFSTPATASNPGTVAPTTGTTEMALAGMEVANPAEIPAAAFDHLLASVTAPSGERSMYIDDVPLYGIGSTVELLGLTVNLGSEE